MAVYVGPDIENNGLALQIDLANPRCVKTVDIGADQHGLSEWVAMQPDVAAIYSAIYPNTTIYSIDQDDVETEILTTGSDPQRGTISTVKGMRYRGSKPIHFTSITAGASQHDIVPLSLSGMVFAFNCSRSSPTTIYVYPVKEDAEIKVFENAAIGADTGVFGTPNQIIKAPKKQVTTITVTALGSHMFVSNTPIAASTTQFGNDRMILVPATNEGYRTRIAYARAIDGGAASVSSGRYLSDDTHAIFATEIADGAGGDSSMFVGKEHLTDTYSIGTPIADFEITAPYANTSVDVSYWEDGAWVLGTTLNFNGSETNPAYTSRDGDNGLLTPATNLSGSAAPLGNGSALWKFEGNNPFHMAYNDSAADDEEILLGWNAADVTTPQIRTQTFFKDMITERSFQGHYQTKCGFGSHNGYPTLTFNGVDQQILVESFPSNNMSVEAWFKPYNINQYCGVYGDGGYFRLYWQGGAVWFWGREQNLGASNELSYPLEGSNRWYHAVGVLESGVGISLYVNGVLRRFTPVAYTYYDGTYNAAIGNNYRTDNVFMNGELASLKHYTRALNAAEVSQNFEATRGRYGV